MYRYIALAWNTQIAERNSLAKRLSRRIESQLSDSRSTLDTDGLLVYEIGTTTKTSRTYELNGKRGVVVGRIFARDKDVEDPHNLVLSARETEKVQQSEGRYLVDRYWGRYVAMVKENYGSRVWIIRDPTGAVPCFITNYRGIEVIFSHVDDCARLGLITRSVNWDHVASYLHFDRLVSRETGLDGVRHVQAGECIAIAAEITSATYYWCPHRIHDKRTLEDRHQAERELRSVIQSCVSTWASCYDSVLHELSGGLDSAVVLACLSSEDVTTNIVCENHFTPNAEGDERAYARQAAKSAGIELVETPISHSDRPIDGLFEPTKVATPSMTAIVPPTQSSREQIVNARGIEAVFSGQGGDHLFQRLNTRQIAAEYAWRHGLRGDILRVISDTSRFSRKPIWSVIGIVMTSGLLKRQQDPYDVIPTPPLVNGKTRDVLSSARFRHPWVDAAAHIPSSKRRQVFDIIDTQNFYYRPNQNADIVHPIISQPIIELCLQIPSYVLTFGGIDRALVRQAFSGLVPADIISRTTKGATTGYFNDLLIQNLPYLREALLGGMLVTEGLLDKRRVEAALTESSLVRNLDLLFPILDAYRAESWLRTWISADKLAAA